jgi:hypothetical protein
VPGQQDRPSQPLQPDSSASGLPDRALPADDDAAGPPGDRGQTWSAEQTSPPGPDHASAADAQRADPPRRWSREELHNRLKDLPPFHPSSPRGDDPRPDDIQQESDALAAAGRRDGDRAPEGHEPRAQDAGRPDGASERAADRPARDLWGEVPGFERAWAAHESRWPADQTATAVDRSCDPAGSWRGDGGRYLGPDQHKQAKDVIASVQRTEKELTKEMTDAEGENTCGGKLEGLKFARKGEERLKEKIADELGVTPALKPEEAISKVHDAIRYTFCFEPEKYSAGYREIKHLLESRELRMVYSKNYWRDNDPEYRGINTRWVTPTGQRFEVQFHTRESFYAKQTLTHRCYERIRNPLTSDEERVELEAYQQKVSRWIRIPEGAQEIPDYRVKGR